jgi:hypothetical protein
MKHLRQELFPVVMYVNVLSFSLMQTRYATFDTDADHETTYTI